MLRLITHIERLLLAHDCIIVPKFGGFVLQAVSANCSSEGHVFRPMRKDLLFNSTLQHQDGLLAESYMKMYGVDYKTAVNLIEEDVEVLIHRLNSAGQIDMGSIGILHIGDEGQFVFSPAEDPVLSVEAYGLPTFYFTPLSLLKHEQEGLFVPVYQHEVKKDAIYIRINRSVLRTVMAAAVVAGLVLLVSTPVKDVNTSTYTASFIPKEITISNPSASKVVADLVDEVISEPVLAEPVDILPEPVVAGVEPMIQKNGKTYYAVIGSFPNEEQGNKYITQEVNETIYPNVGYVRSGNKVRVYTQKFDNREEAEVYIASLRQTEKHKEAWLFISR